MGRKLDIDWGIKKLDCSKKLVILKNKYSIFLFDGVYALLDVFFSSIHADGVKNKKR